MKNNNKDLPITIRRIKDLDFSKEIVIKTLYAPYNLGKDLYVFYKTKMFGISDKEAMDMVNHDVAKINAAGRVLDEIVYPAYAFDKYNPSKDIFAKILSNSLKLPAELEETVHEGLIMNLGNILLFDDLAKYLKVKISNDDINEFVQKYLGNVKDQIKKIDKQILNKIVLQQKVMDALVKKAKIRYDWDSITEAASKAKAAAKEKDNLVKN